MVFRKILNLPRLETNTNDIDSCEYLLEQVIERDSYHKTSTDELLDYFDTSWEEAEEAIENGETYDWYSDISPMELEDLVEEVDDFTVFKAEEDVYAFAAVDSLQHFDPRSDFYSVNNTDFLESWKAVLVGRTFPHLGDGFSCDVEIRLPRNKY